MSMEPFYAGAQQPQQLTVTRAAFIRSAYIHLAVAIFAFIAFSAVLLQTPVGPIMLSFIMKAKYSWLLILGAFMLVSVLATNLADKSSSNSTQLIGLGVYVVAQALIFAPIFTLAMLMDPKIIPAAGVCTLLLVAGLTFTAFTTKKDFSFLGSFLKMAIFIALGLIVGSVVFGFTLGVGFSAIMVLVMAGFVLYDTSNLIHHYPTDRPAGAALHLFASIATMFWYILRIFMSRN